MNLKYEPCKNCGASEYEINSLNTYKCEFCGTEYEIELPDGEYLRNEMGEIKAIYPQSRWIGSTVCMSTISMDKY